MVQISEHTQSVFSGTASSASAARGREEPEQPAPEPGFRDDEEGEGLASKLVGIPEVREVTTSPTPEPEKLPVVQDEPPVQQLTNFPEPVKDLGSTPADKVPNYFEDPAKPGEAHNYGQSEGGHDGHDDAHDYEDVSEEGSIAGTEGCGWKVNRHLKRLEKKARPRSASPGKGMGWKVNNVLAPIEARFTIAPPHNHIPEPPAPSGEVHKPGVGWKLEERLSKAESKFSIIKHHAKPSPEESARMVNLFETPPRPGIGWLVEGQLAAMEKRMKDRAQSPDGKPGLGWKVNDRLVSLEVFKGGHNDH